MNFFDSVEALAGALEALSRSQKVCFALVSPDAPLISNLSVLGNIALIPQYHQFFSWPEAKARALALLNRFGLAEIASRRNPSLTPDERFYALFLRAAAVQNAIIVLDRPFRILTGHQDGGFLFKALGKVEDLIAEAHIFDYTWEKKRYRTDNAAQH